jgi:hypothetical protein
MWRYFVGAAAALLLGLGGMLLFRSGASTTPKLPAVPVAVAAETSGEEMPDEAPSAPEKTREQKRFDRVDKDKNGSIARDEYLIARRKAFAKLDTDHDGKLSFDEWAIKTITKFAGADADKSGTLTRAEFATTAVKRKPKKPACRCAPAAKAPPAQEPAGESED